MHAELTIDRASSVFARVVSPEAGSIVGIVRLEDDEQVVGGGEDVARQLAAAVRADHWRFVVRAVVHCHRVVTRRLRQRLLQLKTLEAQQNVLPTTVTNVSNPSFIDHQRKI